MVVKPIAKLSEYARCTNGQAIELRVTTMGFRPFLAAIRQQTLRPKPVFKAHIRPEQLQGSRASD
jgi:hypothetical protein